MGQKGSMKWGALRSKEGRVSRDQAGRGGHSALTVPQPHSRCLTLT